LALSFLGGCGGDETAEAPVIEAQAPEEVAPEAPAEPERSPIDKARDLAVSGDTSGAMTAARALIAADGSNAAAWRLFRYAGIHGDAAGAASDIPEGAGPLLKTELQLAAGDAVGAMASAKAQLSAKPGGAAALMARAAKAGADAGVLAEGPAASLVAFALAADAKAARKHAEVANGVAGWRAALLRGELAAERGQWAKAYQEFGAVAKNDKLIPSYAGNTARIALAARAGGPKTKGQKPVPARPATAAARWARNALKISAAEGWVSGLQQDAKAAVRNQIRAGLTSGAMASAQLAAERVADTHAAHPDLQLNLARAAMAAGAPKIAATAAKTAAQGFAKAERNKGAAHAAWRSGQAAHALGRIADVQAAADKLEGPRKAVMQALVAQLNGQMKSSAALFPATGLKPGDAAYAYQLAAQTRASTKVSWLNKAIDAADKAGAAGPMIQARLAKESAIRDANKKGAAALRGKLSEMFAESKPMEAELAARSMLSGAPAAFPAGDGMPSTVSAWGALATQSSPAKTEADIGLNQWAHGRSAAASGNLSGHDAHFQKALGALPLHRMGSLGTVTVLDGSEGVDVDTDLALLAKMMSESAVGMSLMAHDVGHRLTVMRRDRSLGRRPTSQLDPAARDTVLAAAAAVRSGMLEWLGAGGAWPAEEIAALDAAEKAASSNLAFASILPVEGTTVRKLLNSLGSGAVLSLRVSGGDVHAVALANVRTECGRCSSVKNLGPVKAIRGAARAHYSAMKSAAATRTKTDHSAGHKMRELVLDPLHADLVGVGNYVIVGPAEITGFPYTTFPDQADGLRWLADIRKTTTMPTVGAISRELRDKDQNTYTLDYLAFTSKVGPSSNEAMLSEHEAPDEIKTCSRHFQSGHDEVLSADKATIAGWIEHAEHSRYIHISSLDQGAGGGFKMADGNLSLDKIRDTALNAQLVVISAEASQPQQMQRARAFLDAGAEWVLITAWPVPDAVRVRYLSAVYESMNHERPPPRALFEGRRNLLKDTLLGDDKDDPSLWGGFLLFGRP
jgi:hypothetical protein